jgi:hypothetical protein
MYLKQNLPKQNHSSWLFVQKIFKKNQKKVKTQKHKNNSRIAIRLLSYHQNFFCPRTELFIALLKIFYFFVNIYSTMMYNIFNATEVKTNIPCK